VPIVPAVVIYRLFPEGKPFVYRIFEAFLAAGCPKPTTFPCKNALLGVKLLGHRESSNPKKVRKYKLHHGLGQKVTSQQLNSHLSSMKPTSIEYLLFLIACILMLGAGAAKRLGLPANSDLFLSMGAGFSLLCYILLVRRRSKLQVRDSEDNAGTTSNFQRIWKDKAKRFWLIAAVVGAVAITIGGPITRDYAGSSADFVREVLAGTMTLITLAAILWWRFRRSQSAYVGVSVFGIVVIAVALVLLFVALILS
jgi:hypothetical protein